jgi:5,10-methylenetetrahydrofolate reductase
VIPKRILESELIKTQEYSADGMGPHGRILYEALPPAADASQRDIENAVERLQPLVDLGVGAVNIPEIINGHYHTIEPRAFGQAIQQAHGLRTIINRITVHHTAPELEAWATDTRGQGIAHYLLVGGERSGKRYRGIGVDRALKLLATQAASLGVVTIAHRRGGWVDEPQRLIGKAEAGATYAVSQILLDAEPAIRLQRDLGAAAPTTHLPIYWSLAPVGRRKDLDFLEWLGVQIPPHVRSELDGASAQARLKASHARNEAIARALLEYGDATGTPVGFCIEHVMDRNVESAFELVERVQQLCAGYAIAR